MPAADKYVSPEHVTALFRQALPASALLTTGDAEGFENGEEALVLLI